MLKKSSMLGRTLTAIKRGAEALGLCSTLEDKRTGDFYISELSFSSLRVAMRTVK